MNERAIFDAALAFDDPTERSAYLDRECGRNSKLRQRVGDLLGALPRLNDFLESPIGPKNELPVLSAKPGDVIGHYKLLQQVGEGGFGVVYMAEQQLPVRRKVALKIIKAGMDSREVIARFEAERQALAMMDHPNIARVLEAGTTETGRPFFVMDLVRGSPITEYCDQNHLTLSERLKLFVPVCRAIQHAHQKGVIHRDIKPSNVLITSADGDPAPKVIDFGVAKAIEHRLTERTMFTRFGQVVGTLEYMSPEQAEMGGLDVDTRSDVYSLGVMLYELLTGSTPLQRVRLKNAPFDEVLRIIREEDPATPSNRISQSGDDLPVISAHRCMEPKKLGAFVRGELDWVVMKALEKNRSRRFPTANEFADDIEHFLRGEPVTACPPSMTYRLSKFAQKHFGLIAGTMFLATVLLVTTPVSIWQAIRATRAQANVRIERDQARKAWDLAKQSTDSESKARLELEYAYQQLSATQSKMSEAHGRAVRNEARLAAEKGHGLIEQGRTREGLLWLMRALNNMPPEETSQRNAIRYNMASVWDDVLKPVVATPSQIMFDVGPDGRIVTWESESAKKSGVGEKADPQENKSESRPTHRIRIWNSDATNSMELAGDWTERPQWLGLSASGKLLSVTNPSHMDRWEIESGTRSGEPIPLSTTGSVRVFLNPNGTRLLSITDGNRAQLTDIESGSVLAELTVKDPSYLTAPIAGFGAFSPDGSVVAIVESSRVSDSESPDGAPLTIMLHRLDAATGTLIEKSKPLQLASDVSRTVKLAFGPRAETMVVAMTDKRSGQSAFQQFDMITGAAIGSPWGDASGLGPWALSPNGLMMATATPQPSVNEVRLELWNLLPQPHRIAETSYTGQIEKLRFDSDGRRLYTIGKGPVVCWAVPETQIRHAMLPHGSAIQAIAFHRDGTVLSISGRQLHRWNMSTGELISPSIDLPMTVNGKVAVTLAPDGNSMAIADGAMILQWDTKTGQPIGRPFLAPSEIMKIEFDQTGSRLLCVCAVDKTKGEIHVIDPVSGARIGSPIGFLCIFDWMAKQKGILQGAVTISPDGKRVLATDKLTHLQTWDPIDSKTTSAIEVAGVLTNTRFTPDGRHVLACMGNQSIDVFDATSGQQIGQRIVVNKPLRACAVTPDSQVLATAIDGQLRFWFLETGQPLGLPIVHNKVTSLCFSNDGELLISGDELGLVRVWNAFHQLDAEDAATSTTEAITGLRFTENGLIEHLEATSWQKELPALRKLETKNPFERMLASQIPRATMDCRSPEERDRAERVLDWFAEQSGGWMGYLLRARNNLDAQRFEPAQAEVKKAIELAPPKMAVLWLKNLAWQEINRRQWDRARWYLDRIVESDLADADVCLAQAETHVAENRRGEANSWLQRAIDLQPTTTPVLRSVGEIDFKLGNWESAASRLARALELGGGNPELWQMRATCCAALGRWDQAAEDMVKSVQRHPRNMELRERLAIALVSTGNLNGYRELCADTIANLDFKDLAIRPWNVPALLALAPDGLPNYEKIIKLGVDFDQAYPGMTECVSNHIYAPYCYRGGQYERSAIATSPANSSQPTQIYEVVILAMAYARTGDVHRAKRKLDEVNSFGWQRLEVWERQRIRLLLAEAEQVISAASADSTEHSAP